jgi:hypothetical protein
MPLLDAISKDLQATILLSLRGDVMQLEERTTPAARVVIGSIATICTLVLIMVLFAFNGTQISARIVLPSTTIAAGSSMSGKVVVTNDTGLALHGKGCGSPFQVVLRNDKIAPEVGRALCLQRITIPAGESTWPVTVFATYLSCDFDAASDQHPSCLRDGTVPPLPAGSYRAMLLQDPQFVPTPSSIGIRVTP